MRRRAPLWLALAALCGCGSSGVTGDPAVLFKTVTQDQISSGAFAPDLLFAIGRQAFDHLWSCAEGGGIGHGGVCTYDRINGPEAQNCAECHNSPLHDGAGLLANNVYRLPDAQNRQYVVRNPPHLFGAGYVEALAAEMTAELQGERAQAVAQAAMSGAAVNVSLSAKSLDFGMLQANPDGTTVYTGTAMQDDLVVRPFLAKGQAVSIREQNIGALVGHQGIQAVELVGEGVDQDGDGVVDEITTGQVSALVGYQALLAMPSFVAVSDAVDQGAQAFRDVGCADCHTPILRLQDPRFFLKDPAQPQQGMWLDLPRDGETPTGLRIGDNGPVLVPLFSDLRRHDVGPALADYRSTPLLSSPLLPVPPLGSPQLAMLPQVAASSFLTTRLWGAGSTAPYLHDGRATDLDQAVLAHDGEAQKSRLAYQQLDDPTRSSLLDFLNSLVLIRTAGLASMPPAAVGY